MSELQDFAEVTRAEIKKLNSGVCILTTYGARFKSFNVHLVKEINLKNQDLVRLLEPISMSSGLFVAIYM